MKSLLDFADGEISQEMQDFLKAKLVTRHVPRGQILLRKGDPVRKSYFVKSGCLRSYALDEKGREHIFMFGPEGWVVSDMGAFATHTPAQLFIDAIEDSEIEEIDNSWMANEAPTYQALTKLMKRVAVLQRRIILLMSATLQERYLDFLETYPDIAQRVPQKMIASYLGVTPEALSKVRGDLSKSK